MYFINDIVMNQEYFKHVLDGNFTEQVKTLRNLECVPEKMKGVLSSMLEEKS